MSSKIIHIYSRSPGEPAYKSSPNDKNPTLGSSHPGDYKYYKKIKNYPYWIGFFHNDWHVQVARETLKLTDRYEIECWRPYFGIDKVYSKKINGIRHKLFPSKKFSFLKYNFGERSDLLIKYLNNEIKESQVLVHSHAIDSLMGAEIVKKTDFSKTPLIGQHHSGVISWPLPFRLPFGGTFFSEKKVLNEYNNFFLLSDFTKNYLEKHIAKERLSIQTMGVDVDFFKKSPKETCRQELDLPLDKKIVLFSGRFNTPKGFFDLLEAIPIICKKRHDLLFIFVGGSLDVIKNKIKQIPPNCFFSDRVVKDKLLKYYNSSDIFILPSHMEGCPVSILEALACNLPVISTSVGGIPLIAKKIPQVNLIKPNDPASIAESIGLYLDSPPIMNVREEVKKYYSWNAIIKQTLEVYDELLSEYYD